MVNFIPLRNYMFYCLDKIIARYNLVPPFLDVGCGTGDLSSYVASKGWYGKAIDFSDIAVEKAKHNLALFPQVEIEKKSLLDEDGHFKTIFLWDVLEHIEDDDIALKKLSSLLLPNGHLLISIPSNPNEWRWDDDFYGHYRRYTTKEIRAKLVKIGLKPLVLWDATFPVFWAMRRVYTKLKSSPRNTGSDKNSKTKASSVVNAWDIPIISHFLDKHFPLWQLLYKMQFSYFRNKLRNGHSMFILARKSDP